MESKHDHPEEPMIVHAEQIRQRVAELAEVLGIPHDSQDRAPGIVLVGSAALHAHAAAAGKTPPRHIGDLDISVAPETLVQLHQHREISWTHTPDGRPIGQLVLRGTSIDIGNGWEDTDHPSLARRSLLLEGMPVASLKEIYHQKSLRDEAKDIVDTAFIATMLKEKILPEQLLQKQIRFVNDLFPEELQHLKDHPLVTIAAHGLHMVDVLLDNNYYQGEVETSGVYAAYHKLEHTAGSLPVLLTHMLTVNARDETAGRPPTYGPLDILASLIAFSFHDVILGHGRQAVSGARCDEQQSADLIYRLILAYDSGMKDEAIQYVAEAAKAGVEATAFAEGVGTQSVQYGSPYEHIQVGTTGADLATLYLWKGPSEALLVGGEDLMRHGMAGQFHRALGQVIEMVSVEESRRIRFRGPKDMFSFIETYGHRVIPSDPEGRTLRDFLLLRLAGSTGFMRPGGYQFPKGWTGEDRKARIRNAYMLMYTRAAIAAGKPVPDAFQMTEDYRANGEIYASAA